MLDGWPSLAGGSDCNALLGKRRSQKPHRLFSNAQFEVGIKGMLENSFVIKAAKRLNLVLSVIRQAARSLDHVKQLLQVKLYSSQPVQWNPYGRLL